LSASVVGGSGAEQPCHPGAYPSRWWTAEIDLDKNDGNTAELRWPDISLTNGSFSQGSAADHHIHGHFHGQDHSEAWGIFHTNAYVGAFGAKRQLQQ